MSTISKSLVANLLLAFDALSSGRTLDDAYLLLEDLGYKDRLILVGHKGIKTLESIVSEPEWAKSPMDKVLIRFRGGPGLPYSTTTIFTGSVKTLVIDRLIKATKDRGLDDILDAIRTIWGINVMRGEESIALEDRKNQLVLDFD